MKIDSAGSIEIRFSKRKLVLILLGSIIFVILGFWYFLSPPKIPISILNNPALIRVVGVASILFFGLGFSFSLKKLVDKSLGLIITSEGFSDNSSGVSGGFVSWEDVSEIKEAAVFNQKFLRIVVRNPEGYIHRQANALKRKVMEANYRNFGSPVSLSANGLECDFDELKKLLNKKLNDFQDQHKS